MQEKGCLTKTGNLQELSNDYCEEMKQYYKPVLALETFIFYYH